MIILRILSSTASSSVDRLFALTVYHDLRSEQTEMGAVYGELNRLYLCSLLRAEPVVDDVDKIVYRDLFVEILSLRRGGNTQCFCCCAIVFEVNVFLSKPLIKRKIARVSFDLILSGNWWNRSVSRHGGFIKLLVSKSMMTALSQILNHKS